MRAAPSPPGARARSCRARRSDGGSSPVALSMQNLGFVEVADLGPAQLRRRLPIVHGERHRIEAVREIPDVEPRLERRPVAADLVQSLVLLAPAPEPAQGLRRPPPI